MRQLLLHLSSFTPVAILPFSSAAPMNLDKILFLTLAASLCQFYSFEISDWSCKLVESVTFSQVLHSVESIDTTRLWLTVPAAHRWHQRYKAAIISETWRRLSTSVSPAANSPATLYINFPLCWARASFEEAQSIGVRSSSLRTRDTVNQDPAEASESVNTRWMGETIFPHAQQFNSYEEVTERWPAINIQ